MSNDQKKYKKVVKRDKETGEIISEEYVEINDDEVVEEEHIVESNNGKPEKEKNPYLKESGLSL